jgi:putative aldouronate transport system substrate-binding protein
MLKMKRTISVLLIVFVIMIMGTGCSAGKSKGADSSQQSKSNSGVKETGYPIVPQKITLKVFAIKGPTALPYEQLDNFKAYEEKTNIHIEWENPPIESASERFNLILASGNLPDMIWNINATQLNQLNSLKLVTPLNNLIDKYGPNLKKVMNEYPDSAKYFTDSTTGDAYFLPFYDELVANSPLCVRQDWLDKLNLKAPVTVQDWEAVWKAIYGSDLNGNGKSDEIPFSGVDINAVRSLIGAWGMLDTFYIDVKGTGKIKYSNIEPKYKEFLTWINQMYKNGYIDKEIASSDSKAFQAKVAQNVIGTFRGTLNGNLNSFNTTVAPKIPGFKYVGTAPMKGPYGDQLHPGSNSIVRTDIIGGVITKTNKYPEASMRYVDYFYDKGEGTYSAQWGVEGKTYTMKDGKPQLTDTLMKNPEGLTPMQVLGKYCFLNQGPAYALKEINFQMWNPNTADAFKMIEPFYNNSIKHVVPTLSFSQEDSSTVRQMMNDIKTYTDEMVIKFIIGVEPLSNWDNYVKRINSMGIDKVLDIYNKNYDNWNKKR